MYPARTPASKDSGRAKIGARAKKEKEQGGAPPPPRSFPFFALAPIFARLESSLARDTQHFARTGTLATQAIVFRALILSEVGADGNIYRDNLIMKK